MNPDPVEFLPVSPSRFVTDPDPVISSPTQGYEKSLEDVALPSQVEFNLDIARRPGQLDSMVGSVDDAIVAESREGEESKEEAEERSADVAQGSIVTGVRETEEYEFADGYGDVHAANVSEVADGYGDCLLYTSRCV